MPLSLSLDEDLPVCECLKQKSSTYFKTAAFEEETPTVGPGIFVWKFLTEEECEDLIKDNLSHNYSLSYIEQKIGGDQTLMAVLLNETFKYSRNQYGKDSRRISALVGTVYYTHLYFTASLWRNASEVYYYFRESILRQSVESPPTSAEIFEPEEAKAALLFFFETYIRNLPLVRLLHLPHYRLQLRLKENSDLIDKI